MLLADVVAASAAATATRSRLAKTAAVADALRAAGPQDAATVAAYLSGVLPQRRIGVSWRGLTTLPAPAAEPSATVAEVDAALTAIGAISGSGSAATRAAAVVGLFERLTEDEQVYLRALVTGQVRQGALDGVMLAAIAAASGVPEAEVTTGGDAGRVLRAGGRRSPHRRQCRPRRDRSARWAARCVRCWPHPHRTSRPPGSRLPRPPQLRPQPPPRSSSTASSTASASRPTATATTCACSPGRSTTSPIVSPRWSRPCWPSRPGGWSSTVRPSPSTRRVAHARSRRRRPAR